MRATRRDAPDPAARLRSLTRRAYTASAGHLDLDDDAGQEFDRIVRGHQPGADGGASREHRAPPARRWAVSGRAVVVVLVVVAALAGAVVARTLTSGPSDAVPLPRLEETDAAGRETDESGPSDGGAGADGAGEGDGAAPSGQGPDGGAPGPGPADGSTTEDSTAAAVVVVHVAGAVAAPGVVTLPAGTRVAGAVEAAGGELPDAELAAVNLARPLVDGEQIYVPQVGEAEPGSAAGSGPSPAGAGGDEGGGGNAVVDLNTADLAELDTLPGVGPAIAQRILDWRDANGSFHSVDELLEVPGIGPATLERLREQVRV